MRTQAIAILLSGSSLASAFQVPLLDKIWPSMSLEQQLAQQVQQVPDAELAANSTRIAIIGAGAAGSSAAFWIAKARERYGLDVEVDIYEKEGYIGGRSTTVYPYNDTTYMPIELGASIFVEINRNMWRASDEFNLTRYGFTNKEDDDEGELGFWDGEKFIITQGTMKGTIGGWLDNIKMLWRYGFTSPMNAQKLVKTMTDQMDKAYGLESPSWENITDLVEAFKWSELVTTTGAEYFASHGVSPQFTNEIIEALTRVNYAQDIDRIHALETACSMAASGAASVKGGNWQIFDKFVEISGANIFLNTKVNSITRKSSTKWTLSTSSKTTDYNSVILAAPYHLSSLLLPSDLHSLIPKQPYIHLHVTLLTTTAPNPNPAYFGLGAGAKAPISILTTKEGARKGGKSPEFNSLNYLSKLRKTEVESKPAGEDEQEIKEEEKEEWVVKIFSMEEISDEWLDFVFQGQVGWVLRKEWDPYPVLPPTASFPPIKLDRGLFYVNAFEPFMSTMETETLASRNVVDWLLKEEYDAAICPPKTSDEEGGAPAQEKAKGPFVYGWDC